jgi:hypothetical protein
MQLETAKRLSEKLPPKAKVLDVGGGAQPFPRADWVIDALAYEDRASLGRLDAGKERFGPDTWVQWDICDKRTWPFEDNSFDYAVCSHLLEDVRDPIWVCAELNRVAKAGYVETPSRVIEQSRGAEHPLYAGFYHHRWLVEQDQQGLTFRFKPHSLHSIKEAIVAEVGVWRDIAPEYRYMSLEWEEGFAFREALEFSEGRVNQELVDFARGARKLPGLTMPSPKPLAQRLKRWLYYQRLKAKAFI